jgi:hypothetical protein
VIEGLTDGQTDRHNAVRLLTGSVRTQYSHPAAETELHTATNKEERRGEGRR